jgi:hypothetical protein
MIDLREIADEDGRWIEVAQDCLQERNLLFSFGTCGL